MGISNIGVPGLIIILIITLIIFGPKKLPEIGAAFGKTLSEFKRSTNELMSDDKENEGKVNTDLKTDAATAEEIKKRL